MAIERVREGERPADVIASYGFNRTTIYKWIAAAFKPGVGVKALRSKPATGRPRTLNPAQERQVFRWINGRDPRQYGLDFGLWTRAIGALNAEGFVELPRCDRLTQRGVDGQKPPAAHQDVGPQVKKR